MTAQEQVRLEERIAQALEADPAKRWEVRDLERLLATEGYSFNTFDVRDAVWRLLGRQKAELTTQLYIKSASDPAPRLGGRGPASAGVLPPPSV